MQNPTPSLVLPMAKPYPKTGYALNERYRRPAPTPDDVRELLRSVPTRPPYEAWIRVVSAVGSVLNDAEAEAVLCEWSPDERPGETRAKLRHRLQRVGFGTLVELARQHGFQRTTGRRTRGTNSRVSPPLRPLEVSTPPPASPARPNALSADLLRVWQEGVEYLTANPAESAKIDAWRGYPAGTIAELAESGFLSLPTIQGTRAIAFAVQDRSGRTLGFHARHKPRQGERPPWSYHPKGTPALPFVVGGGFAPFAKRIVVCEGQWDAIALAASLGWIAADTAFDEHTVIFGVRGAGATRALLDEWLAILPPTAEWHLLRDNDKDGLNGFAKLATILRSPGRVVTLRHPAEGKDVNDALRDQRVTWTEVFA